MAKLIVDGICFKLVPFKDEEELECVVVKNPKVIFGEKTIYFDLKKGIKAHKEGILTIPDGYLLSFMSGFPKLYVVENELSTHDIYNHIGMHFLKYNSSFSEGSKIKVKNYLLEYIKSHPEIHKKIKELIEGSEFSNASEVLDKIIFEEDYGFLVVIDEISEELNLVLKSFNPEVIELKKFVAENDTNNVIYLFDGFQEAVKESLGKSVRKISDVDTIVCPAQTEGFKEVFLRQSKWYAIRISPTMIPQIKFIAIYESQPVSAIRYVGEVANIRPYENTGKYEVIIKNIQKLPQEIKLTKQDMNKVPYAPKYSRMDLIKKAKTIGDVF